jgi:diguanylate cyclase (GGDEF)-like protein
MKSKYTIPSLRITGIYFVFSALWIFLSDYILLVFLENIDSYRYLSTIKGMFFIAISSMIIYYLVKREVKVIRSASMDIAYLNEYDILTKVSNRIAYSKRMDKLLSAKASVSVIITDINGLKLINEKHSFEKGDKVIKSFVDTLQKVLPDESIIYRIGGDEFCVFLDNCDFEQVKDYATKIFSEVKEQPTEIEYSVSIGYSTASNIKNNILEAFSIAEDRMNKNKLLNPTSSRNSIIRSLQSTLFERSDETEMHGFRMVGISEKIADKFNFNYAEKIDLALLALLHDIGKIGVSDLILNKTGPLTTEEYILMKDHSVIGGKITSVIPSLKTISPLILHHHERWDGKGYPDGLKHEETPLCSRILSVVDAYDAMTNERVYRKAISKEKAIEEILNHKGTQFDPTVVDVFLEII